MKHLLYIFLFFVIISCNRNSVNDKINKVGDLAGEAAGSFAKGIGNGATKAFDVKVEMKSSLETLGVKMGKSTKSSDSAGTDNLLSVYLIFDKDFAGNITAKVFDNKSLEMGRAAVFVEGKANDAKYVDFNMGPRTNIDSDCKITIE